MKTNFSRTRQTINKIDFIKNKYGIDKPSPIEKEYLENYEFELAKALMADLGKERVVKIAKYIEIME